MVIKNVLVTSCGNSNQLAKSVAKKLKAKFSPLEISNFPDGDIYLRYKSKLKGKVLIIIESFQPEPNKTLLNLMFAAETAKSLGVKKIILVAPYLAFARQDAAFKSGECISCDVVAKLLRNFDKLISIDPHLHRHSTLKEIFSIPTKKLTANPLIAKYIKKKYKHALVMGPDEESYQWAENIAKMVEADATILKKTRYSSRKVKVKFSSKVSLKGRNVVIVDDIISTGGTIIAAAKQAKKMGAKSVSAICIHGIFAENALEKLKKAGLKNVISTNTIKHKTNKIDVAEIIAEGSVDSLLLENNKNL
jgi:ribose-phosphate pyrophosphokinase